jgi:hypothetical protein
VLVSPVRGIPTSRAYWELKAEQVLNRVFEPQHPIDVEVCETSPQPAAEEFQTSRGARTIPAGQHDLPSQKPTSEVHPGNCPADATTRSNARSLLSRASWIQQLRRQPSALLAGTSLSLMGLATLTLLIVGSWIHSQQAIRQERNLLLMERLRSMGPSSPAAPSDAATASPTSDPGLPPPPPGEPWIEELTSLPASSAPAADVLRVPVNNRIGSPAPAASGGSNTGQTSSNPSGSGNAPQLVGVVQVPGQSGSAIFQIGGSSTSAAVGESIGSSGWRLRSATGDSAIIEKGGEQRRISISSGF